MFGPAKPFVVVTVHLTASVMTTLTETDTHLVKCIGYLHSSTKLRKGDPVPLQYILEEAIKNKYGIVKDYTDLVQACLKPREEEFIPIITTPFEESKGSNSDNELELDLLKEDLMCIICNGMDVGARNRLLECSDCHSLYHQECHKPGVTEDSFDNWVCINCKEASKKIKISNSTPTSTVIINSSGSKSSSKSSSSHRHSSSSTSSSSSSYKTSSYSKSSDKYKSGSSSKSSSSTSSSSSKVTSSSSNTNTNNSNRASLPPNINIISADKRIQIMKKKAATKLQEKRKLPR